MQHLVLRILLVVTFCTVSALDSLAAEVASTCARLHAGDVVSRPPDLYSRDGVLNLTLTYVTAIDEVGRTLFCFKTPDGLESPTLHVQPGDKLDITVTNRVPPLPPGSPTETVSNESNMCGDKTMTGTSLNMHFHGTNTSPTCHGDQVNHTIINSGHTFHYTLNIWEDESAGLHWYHPYV